MDGSTVAIKWAVGVATALLTAGIVAGSTGLIDHGNRITALEVRYQNIEKKLDEIIKRLP